MTTALSIALAIFVIAATVLGKALLACFGTGTGKAAGNEAGRDNGIYYVLGTDRDVVPARVILMTSQAFSTLHEADTYASGCAGAWGAFVVKAVDTSHLRTLSVPH